MKRRLDYLAAMGTTIITISGGEPLMHPELEEVIRHVRKHGMIAGMIQWFLLSKERIKSLNDAGLEHLQISIDNVTPDEVSKKSLKTLDSRLEWLSEHAIFQVNINSVLGSGVKNPEDALTIAHRAIDLALRARWELFTTDGAAEALNGRQIEIL
jgi:MoaA/NifB/PqqE/SkfB family radical SAM enzyme